MGEKCYLAPIPLTPKLYNDDVTLYSLPSMVWKPPQGKMEGEMRADHKIVSFLYRYIQYEIEQQILYINVSEHFGRRPRFVIVFFGCTSLWLW